MLVLEFHLEVELEHLPRYVEQKLPGKVGPQLMQVNLCEND
jgi:hypothetical protein